MMAADSDPDGVSRSCTSFETTAKISSDDANAIVQSGAEKGSDNALDDIVDKWHYVKA